MKNHMKIWRLCKWLSILLMAIALGWTASSMPLSNDYFQWEPNLLESGWVQIVNGQEIPLEQVEDYQSVPVGETLVLIVQLPDIQDDMALFFYSKDVEVAVYCEDELIYTFQMDERFSFLKSPGHGWNYVELPVEHSGHTLRLELTSQFDNRYSTTISGLYFIESNNTTSVVWREKGFLILMGVVVLVMAGVSYICAAIWKRKSIKQYYFALANFYLCASLWILPMSGLMTYFFHRPLLSYLCSMVFAVFVPVTIYELMKVIYQKKSKRMTALGILFWGNFLIQFMLQFIFGISMLDMLFATELVYVVGCLLGIWIIGDHYRTCRGTPELKIPFITILIMIGGALIEIPILLLLPERTELIGVASLVGLILYLVVNQIYMAYRESSADMASIALEQDYRKLQNTGLMYQIKSHFFFNTLNTISALCKCNPAEADRAIILFSQYMRAHMYLINQHDNIPFRMEMKLVESTLGIEAVRFPDSFSYSVDTPHTDFSLPPLTIQPIVENALVHGLRNREHQGKVEIQSRFENGVTVVTITDNGEGFDVTQMPPDGHSLGIKNLTKRVELMAHGTVQIESQLGQGTKVTLTFPDKIT